MCIFADLTVTLEMDVGELGNLPAAVNPAIGNPDVNNPADDDDFFGSDKSFLRNRWSEQYFASSSLHHKSHGTGWYPTGMQERESKRQRQGSVFVCKRECL